MSDASSPDGSSPGIVLREARLQRGLSQDQVTAETNISPRYVQALEENDYGALPGQAFARGYLRRYAQLVQVDADALVPAFDRLWRQQHPEVPSGLAASAGGGKATVAERPARAAASLMDQGLDQLAGSLRQMSLSRLLSVGSLALLGLLLVGTLFWQGGDEPEVPHIDETMPLDIDAEMAGSAQPSELPPLVEPAPAVPVVTPAPDAAALPAATPAVAPAIAPATAPGAAPAAAVTPATTPVAVPATSVMPQPAPAAVKPVLMPAAPAMNTAPAPAAAIPAVETLNFSFAGKSWISVRDATGQELVYGLKGEGQAVTVTGQAPFSINIGNVKVTTMTRNGKPVSLKPYTRGEIASFRLNK